MSRIIVDVGANEGLFALQQAMENPHHLVIAVEPIPELATALIAKALDFNLANLVVRECHLEDYGCYPKCGKKLHKESQIYQELTC